MISNRLSLTRYKFIFTLFFTLLLSSCSIIEGWMPEQIDETKSWSASKLYAEAKYELNGGDYKTAIEYYEKLEARYPHGKYAQQAQLEIAYAYYRFDEPESAIAATERFIKLHPLHPHVDYAYYLRGLVVFPARKNVFEYVWPQDESKRDTQTSMESFRYFGQLTTRFPDSIYSHDAVTRMRYLRNKVAKHQLHVANFYLKQQAYLAAANRAKYIVQKYSESPAVQEALLIMIQAYKKLDLPELVRDTQQIYTSNKDKFVEDIYLEQESVIPYMPDWMRPY
ncbi:MAG: outer membrane protein assembly factor BamD [Pseudomonadota bacterium]